MLQLPFPSKLPSSLYIFLDTTFLVLLGYLQQFSLTLLSAIVDDLMALTQLLCVSS